jgi:glycerophosphoryl diester phosphodiesterase
MNKPLIVSHRGLEPSNLDFYPESSYEAFREHVKKGYSIELDINFCKDEIIISHDTNLKRLCGLNKELSELYYEDIKDIEYGENKKGHLCTFKQIIKLITTKKDMICVIHLKGNLQKKENLDKLIKYINKHPLSIKNLLIFDLYPESAKYIKENIPHISLGCSVANNIDIKKYNNRVHGTLLSVKDAITNKRKGYYNWAIIDEWDLYESGTLYTKSIFDQLKKEGYKILSIFPELHEDHYSAQNNKRLFKRMYHILELEPHAVCTNYPAEIYPYIKTKRRL